MAKAKNPLFSQEAYGPMGGILFRRGTYGAVISRTSGAPHLMTPAQTKQRALLAAAHKAYDALTDQNREAWAAIATYPETGRNAYIRAYTRLQRARFTPQPSPQIDDSPQRITITDAFVDNQTLPSIWITWDHTPGTTQLIFAYALATYSHRAAPKPSKLIYAGHDQTGTGHMHVYPKHPAPVYWVRLDTISVGSGRILSRTLIKVE